MSKAASINAAAYSIMGVTATINIIITALDIVLPSICSAGLAAATSIVSGIIAMMLFAIYIK
jgi:hypothetical protein